MGFMVVYYEDYFLMENGDYYIVFGETDDKKSFIGEIRNDEDDWSEKYTMSKDELKYWIKENGIYFDGYFEYREERDCFKNNY